MMRIKKPNHLIFPAIIFALASCGGGSGGGDGTPNTASSDKEESLPTSPQDTNSGGQGDTSSTTPPEQPDSTIPDHSTDTNTPHTGNSDWETFYASIPKTMKESFLWVQFPETGKVALIPKEFRPIPQRTSWHFIDSRPPFDLSYYRFASQFRRAASLELEQDAEALTIAAGFPIMRWEEGQSLIPNLQVTRSFPVSIEAFKDQIQCSVNSHTLQYEGNTIELKFPNCSIEFAPGNTFNFQLTGDTSARDNAIEVQYFSNVEPKINLVRLLQIQLYKDLYSPILELLQPGDESRLSPKISLDIQWSIKSERSKLVAFNLQWSEMVKQATQYLEMHQWIINDENKSQFFHDLIAHRTMGDALTWELTEGDAIQESQLALALEKKLTPVLFSRIKLNEKIYYMAAENPDLLLKNRGQMAKWSLYLNETLPNTQQSHLDFACMKLQDPVRSTPFLNVKFLADPDANDCDSEEFFN